MALYRPSGDAQPPGCGNLHAHGAASLTAATRDGCGALQDAVRTHTAGYADMYVLAALSSRRQLLHAAR